MQGTGVCVARALYGARCHPCPLENLEISPLRSLHCARGSHSLRNRARHLCARGAGLTRRRSPTIGRASTSGCVQNPVWASPGRRFVPVPRMSGIYFSQQGLSRHKQPDELNAVAKSLSPCPCCVCSGQARGEAGRAASGFLSHPPTLACVLFPGLVWGVTALHKTRSHNNYNTYRQPASFGSSALDVFRLPGPPQAESGRQRASRARTNDRDIFN